MAEVFIFRLSSVLGGRREVLETPFVELLSHVDQMNKTEKAKSYREFLNIAYASPMIDKKARQDYIKQIQPDIPLGKDSGKAKVTDLNQLRLIKEMQAREDALNREGG